MDFETCKKRGFAKKITPDASLVTSICKTRDNKAQTNKEIPLSEVTATTKICLAYDCLRETLEAIAIQKGYKIYNHECYTNFLETMLEKREEAHLFDQVRKLRNNINYYGHEISVQDAQEVLKQINELHATLAGSIEQ